MTIDGRPLLMLLVFYGSEKRKKGKRVGIPSLLVIMTNWMESVFF
jgi:hypothetical protein